MFEDYQKRRKSLAATRAVRNMDRNPVGGCLVEQPKAHSDLETGEPLSRGEIPE